jgi:hypothetical protein
MTPTQAVPGAVEGGKVLLKEMILDELCLVLIFDRHKHADDISEQVAAALGYAVQEQGLPKWALNEFAVFLVKRIRLHRNPHKRHVTPPGLDLPSAWNRLSVLSTFGFA